MELLVLAGDIALATLPGLFWLWWFVRQDRDEPEPRRYLWRIFLLGALVTIPTLFVEFALALFIPYTAPQLNATTILGTLFIIGPLEEVAKFIVVYAALFRHRIFNERVDGVVYMIVAALGFATVENILVVLSQGSAVLPLRLVTATLLHALASGLVGYFLGLAKFATKNRGRLIFQGLIIGSLLHGLYDFIAISDSDLKLVLLLIFILLMFLILQASVKHLQSDDRGTS